MKRISIMAGMLLAFGSIITSCKKDKTDHQYDNRIIQDTRSNSGIRIVNMANHNQVIVNGDTLTNYQVFGPTDPNWKLYGTKYFPEKGQLSTTWYVPKHFLNAAGKATLKTEARSYQSIPDPAVFEVAENYSQPADYYIVRSSIYTTGEIPQVNRIPRSVEAPAKADHFKIRIVNLSAGIKSPDATQEKIDGPMSLAWADGTPVNTATSNVPAGKYSDYIELPYGTYQFKVMSKAGTQVSAFGGNNEENTKVIDPATSTMTKGAIGIPHTVSVGITYAPIRTYQPGGIYTIVIAPFIFTVPYYLGGSGEETTISQNGFQVVTDISEPMNITYARIHGVNALPGSNAIRLKVNGRQAGNDINYATAGEYITTVTGMTTIEATDAAGKVLAARQQFLTAGQNYSSWVYADANGAAQIAVAANNLSGNLFNPGEDGQDGTYQRRQYKLPFQYRFLNFCPDFANVNFTGDNGQSIGGSGTKNLQPGVIPQETSNAIKGATIMNFKMMAFQSPANVFPGTWLTQIPLLKSSDFIARKELYTRAPMPETEPGFFTVALIGRNGPNVPAAAKARMIIVKHNR
ncbi:DUF4397 domain-containing protein [Chitinophaga nivalis]|uniref:DUF4397 domain-containing protein n=1 Tax=Chitinophaga nivalis TaxID=2991709 RepID=A0ABT3IGM5_9BACT|nr:DUF4397 domain-containing protein [Chitinophaga nivalis]MCW3467215.1 DUF4397 domain-containing protein [Chitinophaga nivalis]MCW3483093.1 DUF4397 domain-containing protein [Chitinophaga nivalis]